MIPRWTIIVPARLESTRLPKKPLQDLHGKPLIIRVLENLSPLQAQSCRLVAAVDDELVLKTVNAFGFKGVMTSVHHQSGTDRCLEAINLLQNASSVRPPSNQMEYILNVQGNEPFVALDDLRNLMKLVEQSGFDFSSLYTHDHDMETVLNPNVVKVLLRDSKAVYFSRAPLPFPRDYNTKTSSKISANPYALHVGVYAFTISGLRRFCSLAKSTWEETERLEQLRWIQSGLEMGMIHCSKRTIGIDTPKDLVHAKKLFADTP